MNQSTLIRTPDYRLRAFVSSTLKELADERYAVREAILRLRLAPVMFELGARPHPADNLYHAYLSQSHIFIGIYWQSYGWVAPGKQISGLEDEYILSEGMPRLLYIKNPAPDRDPALKALLGKIQDDNVGCYKSFSSPDELKELVESDLALLLAERFEARYEADKRGEDIAQQPLTNVPFPRNPMIGREEELGMVCEMLLREDVALITLTGPGGCGKSRLGIEVALELRDRFADGVFLVILECIDDPAMVIPTIAKTLGITQTAGGSALIQLVKEFLSQKQILLLLDNFEHLLKAGPEIANLLEGCTDVKFMVTSRAPLRLRAETLFPVPPLSLPSPRKGSQIQPLSQYSAVQLFIQRAQAVQPNFQITAKNAPAVAEICFRLDGLPLAIELAAARIKMLSPQVLLELLEESFEILKSGSRDLPERQQTLNSAIEWSYNLLDEAEKRLLRRSAVFVGGWSFEAADAVCNAEGEGQMNIFNGLEKLIDLNLIKPAQEFNGELRFGILETIREFSLQRLIQSSEIDAVRERQARYFLALVEQASSELQASDQMRWFTRLDTETPNLRTVLAWSQQHDCELGLRLCSDLWRYWEMHNLISEGRQWLETFLSFSKEISPIRGKALINAAACAVYQGDFETARVRVEEAFSIFQDLEDKYGTARALNEMGLIASYQGDFESAERYLQESLAIRRELGNQLSIANALNNLGLVADYKGEYTTAYKRHQKSLALYQTINDRSGAAMAIGNLGHVALHLGKLQEARERQIESIQIFNEFGDKDGLAECFERLAIAASMAADFKTAAQWFGVANALRKEAGTLQALPDRLEFERELEKTRTHLGAECFDEVWESGHRMGLEEAIALAVS